MIRLAIIAALGLTCAACGGRASLDSESGRAFRQSWMMQAASRPSPPLADLSAADAEIAMQNHDARYRVGQKSSTGASNVAGGGAGRGGELTPATSDFGFGSDSDRGGSRNRGISLEAR